VISFDEAIALLRDVAKPLGSERVPLEQAHRRILAAPVVAGVDSPPSDCSAMDGYAVRDADLRGFPVRLPLAGESFPGNEVTKELAPGHCVRIFTGAPVPGGADRVVIQENVVREGEVAVIAAPPGAPRHIRPRGSDFLAGDLLLEAGRRLDPRALVAAAAADRPEVEVWCRPRLVILGSGDELVEPGAAATTPGAIPESLSIGIAALAVEWGAEFSGRSRLRDELISMRRAAADALDIADLVVVTGGASVGDRDFAKAMFDDAGLELIFSKVAIKPGKPVWLGRARDRLVIGLPGNPTSALVTGRLFLAPLLAGLTGRDPGEALCWRRVPLANAAPAVAERETFVRARRNRDGGELISNQDSGAQRALAAADLLVRRPAHAPAAGAGELADMLDF